MLTKTHATTSLGDIDESHGIVHATIASVIGFSLITGVVASVSLFGAVFN